MIDKTADALEAYLQAQVGGLAAEDAWTTKTTIDRALTLEEQAAKDSAKAGMKDAAKEAAKKAAGAAAVAS